MPKVESEIIVQADPDRVYTVAKDVEKFPEFLPDVQSVKVLKREGSRVVSEWVGIIKQFNRTLRWTEEDDWDDAQRQCSFRAISGDWDKYEGVWKFESHPEGTMMQLTVDYEFNIPLIGPLIKGVLTKLVKLNCDQMLEGLRQRVMENRDV